MLLNPVSFATLHPNISYWLDECLKIGAVAIGGFWTLWNYRKSRTYAQKMELQLAGATFRNNALYFEVEARLKNLGASRHAVEQRGSYCEVTAVFRDLTEETIDIRAVFTRETFIEPGESINDFFLFRLPLELENLIWLRLRLRVVSKGLEWWEDEVVRVKPEGDSQLPAGKGE